MRRTVRFGIAQALDADGTLFEGQPHDGQDALLEFAFGAFDAHDGIVHRDGDAGGNGDCDLTYA